MIVCHCRGVTDREIKRCVRAGRGSASAVSEACGAASGCGGCWPRVCEIVDAELESQQRRSSLPTLHVALIVGG
jgi:bacterioferritin-associated ferredoxin